MGTGVRESVVEIISNISEITINVNIMAEKVKRDGKKIHRHILGKSKLVCKHTNIQ